MGKLPGAFNDNKTAPGAALACRPPDTFPMTAAHRFTAALVLACSLLTGAASAFPIISKDGKTVDLPVIRRADKTGLIVRKGAATPDIPLGWDRIDLEATARLLPWMNSVYKRASAGQTVVLDLGINGRKADDLIEWVDFSSVVAGGEDKNFARATMKLTAHKEVPKSKLIIVFVGAENPLLGDPAWEAFAKERSAAFLTLNFEGTDYMDARKASGDVIMKELPALLEKAGRKTTAEAGLLMIAENKRATWLWSYVTCYPKSVLAAVCVDAKHVAEANQGSFFTPLLLVSSSPVTLAPDKEDLQNPADLHRHYSTDGCRWCYVEPAEGREGKDPLPLALSFFRGVAAVSPYDNLFDLLDDFETNPLRARLAKPTGSFKDLNDDGFLLASRKSKESYPWKTKTGESRRGLVWLPDATFAKEWAKF